jgi:hypothetical protein
MAFYALEPWGAMIEDHRFGVVAATLVNLKRDPKRHPDAFRWFDFFPQPQPKTPMKQKKTAEAKKVATGLKAAFAGRIKREKKKR